MKSNTKLKFSALLTAMATTYQVDSVATDFNVTPSIQQELVDALVQDSGFLSEINYVMVDDLKGEKILGGAKKTPASRTNTSTNARTPKDILNLTNKGYELAKVEFDTLIRYVTIDSWAKFPDLAQRYSKYVMEARRAALLMTGWYGETRAPVTNATTNPLGQDVDKGWLQILRDFNGGSQFYSQGSTANEIRIGDGGDFPNLDSAAHAAKEMIDELHLSDDAVIVLGDDLVSDEKARLYAALGQTPTEKERIQTELVTQTYGGLPRKRVPGFPARGLLITHISNLSYYEQEGSMRKSVVDNASRDQIENYCSMNGGYVIEDEEAAAAFEFKNVKIKQGNDWV